MKADCENNFGNKRPATESIYLSQELQLWGRLGTVAIITLKPQWGVETFILSCIS